MTEGLFDDNAGPALAISVQTGGTETLDDLGILAGRRRQVEDAIATGTTFLIKRIE